MPDEPVNPSLREQGSSAAPLRPGVSAEAVKLGYEPSGVNLGRLGIFFIFFCITAPVIHAAVWFLLKHYVSDDRPAPLISAVQRVERLREPSLQPTPEHDSTPSQDLDRMRAGENRVFTRMGWTLDARTGDVVIPDSIVTALAARTAHPSTAPATNTYEIPYTPATQYGDPTEARP